MTYENFLMDTYFGDFGETAFRRYRDLPENEKTRKIIDSYLEISKERSPDLAGEEKQISSELMDKLKGMGFFGLNIPETHGGVGLDLLEYLKVVEAVAPHSLSLGITGLAHLSIGIKGIILFGNDEQKGKYLPRAATGEMIFAYALTEPETGSDARNIKTTAVLSDDGRHYILNGQKTYITNANYAGGMTLFAQMDPAQPGFMGAFVVETAWEGVTIGKEMPKMGLKGSSTAMVGLEDVKVPVENLLGEAGDGFKIAMTILNYGRLALGAASSGMMKQSLADMTKRAGTREQFGMPIGDFELIQEKLVAAKVNRYAVSSITALTAAMLEADPLAPVAAESSHCKLFGTTRAWDTLYDALQVAGGSGYLSTQPYEKRMRDFRVTTIFEGTTEIHSIYPALFMMRKLATAAESAGSGKIAQLAFLAKEVFRRTDLRPAFRQREMKRAARTARALARSIRLLLVAGLLRYGNKITTREYYLRRITFLSFYCYGLLAMLARIEIAEKAGIPVTEERKLLAFFRDEARRFRRRNRKPGSYKREVLSRKIYDGIAT